MYILVATYVLYSPSLNIIIYIYIYIYIILAEVCRLRLEGRRLPSGEEMTTGVAQCYINVYMYICICIHTYIHLHTYIYIYIYIDR